jgi:hypothetical protein
MPLLNLADYQGVYHNRVAWIVGRGKTQYDYADLAKTTDPVIFINDAVSLEHLLNDQQESFVVFLDKCMRVWLQQPIRSIAVAHQHVMGAPGFSPLPVVRIIKFWPERGFITADQMARESKLFTQQGTICTVLCLCWFMGIRDVRLIGCGGRNEKRKRSPYDPRIQTLSKSIPGWVYNEIRIKQDNLLRHWQMKSEYLGEYP